ncbi:hypothetical protein BDV96DRAFT_627782, partial [Lophiotrema nucula]
EILVAKGSWTWAQYPNASLPQSDHIASDTLSKKGRGPSTHPSFVSSLVDLPRSSIAVRFRKRHQSKFPREH